MLRWLAYHRRPVQAVADIAMLAAAMVLAHALRFDLAPKHWLPQGLILLSGVAACTQLGVGLILHLYRGRYRFGAFEEVLGVFQTVTTTTIAIECWCLLQPTYLGVPRSVPVVGGMIALVFMLGGRYAWRLFLEARKRPDSTTMKPLLVFGAGDAADQIIAAMLRDPSSAFHPVGVLDDDPRKRNLRLRGVRVLGGRDDLPHAAESTGALTLLLAIPSAGSDLVREIRLLAEANRLSLKILPPVSELVDGQVHARDIRDVAIADLLGRRPIELNTAEIVEYIAGKRVLVTGAGGSIGSELCRHVSRFGPAELIMLDRDESALHAVQLAITGRATLDSEELVLADIRDIDHIQEVFERHRPEVVFHAAALKHLTLLERFPGEAVKSNVWGSLTVLDAAASVGVEHFVNISTDKAAEPTSVLGYSKRIAERLTSYFGHANGGTYISVRFGNVLGSRGSVLTTFAAQIAAGGPLTVTHPDVQRYFMTINEAAQLVIQAGAVGRPGEVLVLDMGSPVVIADLARQLARDAPEPLEIVYTGLRPGEKLDEKLLAKDEVDFRPNHALISQVAVPPIAPELARALDPWSARAEVVTQLANLTMRDAPVNDDAALGSA